RLTTAKAFAKDVFINQGRRLGDRKRSDTRGMAPPSKVCLSMCLVVAPRLPVTGSKSAKDVGAIL
ncbi:hypothetical protein NEOLEDRAFT_1081780, partial [Neolentinus lepideus HHB14362 ss-1]